MCILFVYTLLNVVRYYDLSFLSISVMGLQKGDRVGGVSSIEFYFGFLGFIFTLQSPLKQDTLDRTKWKNDIQYHCGDPRLW